MSLPDLDMIQSVMEYRSLGRTGLKVPVLCFGTGTFGGRGEFFNAWGSTDVAEATKLLDICLEAGVNFFDTADIYSRGLSEEILGKAHRRPAPRGIDLDEGDVSDGGGTE